ncbi:unnamed protein product [Bursaphelenchus okinawaensis]|uniref:Uncharacterized protein n=1 Tax=Bursaphelenchus okinawaensis TaxID=465554 RepID=A0A811KDF0_9BILA|nr:unnamed protein product [Bursaphelenchus okinawaensis]CAG9101028.1 unnamed protein product [Bursaphelenchus okinawaensis]
MRLSTLRTAEKFVANRKAFFGQRYDFFRSAGPHFAAGTATLAIVTTFIYFFAFPTPDIRHDMQYFFSSNYRKYVDSKGLIDPHRQQRLENEIQGFYVRNTKAKQKRMLHEIEHEVFLHAK